jgi:hypothetical protein
MMIQWYQKRHIELEFVLRCLKCWIHSLLHVHLFSHRLAIKIPISFGDNNEYNQKVISIPRCFFSSLNFKLVACPACQIGSMVVSPRNRSW